MSRIYDPTSKNIQKAAELLRAGALVAMPTETVYGLACDAANSEAVARLYAAKDRPQFNPLIAHICDLETAKHEGVFNQGALGLAHQVWPGPLTLVTPLAPTHTVCDLARAGLSSIALRVPAHPVARALLTAFGGPLVAPSANPSGQISPTSAAHVAKDMGDKVDFILDGGACEIGLESTIISCLSDTPQILRYGAYQAPDIFFAEQDKRKPDAPGALSRHYAPKATLRLNAAYPEGKEAYLGFGPALIHSTLNLSEAGNLNEAAANLFHMLRRLDETWPAIAVAPIPKTGLGLAINDRLTRAATRESISHD